MASKAILFVDDEANILLGLKRMLRSMRNEMDFYFAESGSEALSILTSHEINIIVSDMRMPGMDGAALLTTVMEKYPHIIRIMLTGNADDSSILLSIPIVHQFLAKPSDPDTLKEVLYRACALQELISDQQLKTLVASLGNLPSLPEIYAELQERTKDPDCAIQDIAVIIEKDLAMSTKVLQLVNSAFYGLYKNIDSPGRAVNLLGLDTVKSLVLGVGVFTELAPLSENGFSITKLWDHSIMTANFAKAIARLETDEQHVIENSFIGGIVHDIGKLLLYSSLTKKYLQSVAMANDDSVLLSAAEKEVFSADHSDIGGYLIGLWGLPGPVVEAVTFHHKLDQYPEASFCPALAVHAADVAYYMLNPDTCVGKPPEINQEFLNQAELSGNFEQWLDACKDIQKGAESDG